MFFSTRKDFKISTSFLTWQEVFSWHGFLIIIIYAFKQHIKSFDAFKWKNCLCSFLLEVEIRPDINHFAWAFNFSTQPSSYELSWTQLQYVSWGTSSCAWACLGINIIITTQPITYYLLVEICSWILNVSWVRFVTGILFIVYR